MEFRFLVPVLPFVFLLLAWAILFIRRREIRAALVALLVVGSLYHARTFTHRDGIEGIGLLRNHIDGADDNWRGIGRALGGALGHDPGVTIATTAAGTIPFYSRLRTVDMHGLNDRWVARNGILMGSRPLQVYKSKIMEISLISSDIAGFAPLDGLGKTIKSSQIKQLMIPRVAGMVLAFRNPRYEGSNGSCSNFGV